MSKPMEIFKALAEIDADIDVVEKWISALPKVSSQEEARLRVEALHYSKKTASCIRNVIFACHLADQWGASFEEAFHLVERSLNKYKSYSIERLCTTLNTLQEVSFDKNLVIQFLNHVVLYKIII